MAIRPQAFWDDEATRPGVKKGDFDTWETRTGCSLPKLLRKLYALHDGGPVRYAPFRLYPLNELVVTTADFWSAVEYTKKLVPVKSLVFALGEDIDHGDHLYFLNFNAKGPTGEPSVCHLWHDPAALVLASKSVKVFLDQEVGVTETPMVEWSTAEGLDPILHREVIESGILREDVIFGRSGSELIWYNRRAIGDEVSFRLVKLPLPLNQGWGTIQRYRPGPVTWSLMLQPVNQEGIVSIESTRRGDGRWKNEIDHGVPGHVMLESANEDALTRLQKVLFASQ